MLFILRENRIGFPITTLTPDNMVAFIKTTLAIQVLYYTNVFCIKTSILLTYLRFAVTRTFRMLCVSTIILHAIFFFICFVVTLSQCRPLHKMWDFTGSVAGSCIDTTAFFYSTSAFNIVTDIWILVLPYKPLREIQRPRREKIALFLIFGAGAFAATASIVRLHTIYIYTLSPDPIRDGIPVNLWSIIEVTVAISCASVPALKPLFSRRQRAATRAAKSVSTGSARSLPRSLPRGTAALNSQPRLYSFSYEPPQVYEARQVFEEAQQDRERDREQNRDREKERLDLNATLGFHSPPEAPRPVVDREHTESSGMSLGLPLQQPLQPLTPPPASHSRLPVSNPVVVNPDAGVPKRNPSQGSLGSSKPGRPPVPRRSSSQRSTGSVPGAVHTRPGPPSRTSSQKSVTFQDDGWPLSGAGNSKSRGLEGNGSQGSFYLE